MRNLILLIFLSVIVCCKKDDIKLLPKACFDYYAKNSFIIVGDTVRFTNCSKNANNFFWNFGDNIFSVDSTPIHIYSIPGTYQIKLTSSDDEITDSCINSIVINERSVYTGKKNQNMYYFKIDPEFYLDYKFNGCGYGDKTDSFDIFNDRQYDLVLSVRFLDFNAFLNCCPNGVDCLPTDLVFRIRSKNDIEIATCIEKFLDYTFVFVDTLTFNTRIDTIINWKNKTEFWNNNIPYPHQGPWYYIQNDYFIAIRKKEFDRYRYGWIRIGSHTDHNLVFKELAIEN